MLPQVPLFVPGGPELLIVLGILILLFGAQKIPQLARATGESIGEFQKGKAESELEETNTGSSTSRNTNKEPQRE